MATIKGDSFNDWYSRLRQDINTKRLANELRQGARSYKFDTTGVDPMDDVTIKKHLSTLYKGFTESRASVAATAAEWERLAEEMDKSIDKICDQHKTLIKHMMYLWGGMAIVVILLIISFFVGGGDSGQTW